MTLKIVEEVTVWAVPYRQPNHVYLMDGDKVYAMSRWGQSKPEYFTNPSRIDRRGRKFIEIKNNRWKFDLSISVESAKTVQTKGQTWTVRGSKGDAYTVSLDSGHWNCTCPGHGFRGRCRHVDELRESNPLLG